MLEVKELISGLKNTNIEYGHKKTKPWQSQNWYFFQNCSKIFLELFEDEDSFEYMK